MLLVTVSLQQRWDDIWYVLRLYGPTLKYLVVKKKKSYEEQSNEGHP